MLRNTVQNINTHAYTAQKIQPYTKVTPPFADLAFLAKTTQTPFFLLDLHAVRRQINVFEDLFPDTHIYYSTKTNPHPAILSLVAEHGHGFDVATLPEIRLTLEYGAKPANLLYTHPVKSVEEIKTAYTLGIRKFTFDSLDELRRHGQHAPNAENYLRISPLSNASLYNYKRKFGVSTEELIDIMDYAIKHNIQIAGLTFMVGSQSMSLRPWLDMFERIIAIIDYYYEAMPTLRTINIGSGFPLDYGFENAPQIEEIALATKRFKQMLPSDIQLIAEPGRFIAAPSTTLVTRVVQRIRRQGQDWLYTDANAYSGLIEVIENGGHFPYPISSPKAGPLTSYMIAGKTLDPDDILGKAVPLSNAITANDTLYVHETGAYSSTFFTSYHSLPHPTVIVHDSEYTKNVELGLNDTSINGIHAKRNFKAGELIFTVSGTPSVVRTRTTFQTQANRHVEPNLYGAFLNHSCKPNAGIHTNTTTNHLEVIAMYDIQAGEDIVADYAMFEYETSSMASVECVCGSDVCRKRITGFKDLPRHTQRMYKGFMAAHLVKS